ncbi:hypothetical protein BU59_23130 [Escherichia coli O69:H11 str. 07-3763]|nr:hypothetical protein BU59_23130 [Escherichia coli O69:H11 str. 07-3763]
MRRCRVLSGLQNRTVGRIRRSRRIRQTAPDATFTPVRSDPRSAPHHPLRDKSRSALQLNRAEFSPGFPGNASPPAEYKWTRFHQAV